MQAPNPAAFVVGKLVLKEAAPEIDKTLLRNLARGWNWFEEIKQGASMDKIAAQAGVSQRAVARLIDLAFLSPDIVETIVVGRQPSNLTSNTIVRAPHVMLWWDQRMVLNSL